MTTRDRIIDVAGRLFAERGYDGVSVREITKAAGANLAAVGYHFGGKEDLFGEVIKRKTEALRQIGVAIAASRKKPAAKLKAMLEAYALHILHDDPSLRVLFAQLISCTTRMPKIAMENIAMRDRLFADAMRAGIEDGVFRACDVQCAATCFFGMITPYILYQPIATGSGRLQPYPRDQVRRIVDESYRIFTEGVMTR